jgi:hypothetical protein
VNFKGHNLNGVQKPNETGCADDLTTETECQCEVDFDIPPRSTSSSSRLSSENYMSPRPRDRAFLRRGVLIREALRTHGAPFLKHSFEDIARSRPLPAPFISQQVPTLTIRKEWQESARVTRIPCPSRNTLIVFLHEATFFASRRVNDMRHPRTQIPQPVDCTV